MILLFRGQKYINIDMIRAISYQILVKIQVLAVVVHGRLEVVETGVCLVKLVVHIHRLFRGAA
jgi:hypothetical protein